jgi:hypothetical protein
MIRSYVLCNIIAIIIVMKAVCIYYNITLKYIIIKFSLNFLILEVCHLFLYNNGTVTRPSMEEYATVSSQLRHLLLSINNSILQDGVILNSIKLATELIN